MSLERIRLVLFDLGGVIVSWSDTWLYQHVAKRWQVEESILTEECERLLPDLHSGKLSENEYWNMVSKGLNINVLSGPEESMIKTVFKDKAKINTEILPIIERLKKNNVKLGVLSNTERMAFDALDEHGILSHFHYLFVSFRIGTTKPNPAIYLHVIRNVPYAPNEILLIDDKAKNIAVAEEVGMKGLLFNDSLTLTVELKKDGVIS